MSQYEDITDSALEQLRKQGWGLMRSFIGAQGSGKTSKAETYAADLRRREGIPTMIFEQTDGKATHVWGRKCAG